MKEELADLIERCGDKFRHLVKHHDKTKKQGHIAKHGEGVDWEAKAQWLIGRGGNDNRIILAKARGWGKTPQEAMKNLVKTLEVRNEI